ncbi:aminopeptidase P family protein [Arcticibacter tournemirensis]
MFSKETYINRRNELKNKVQSGILLFLGNEDSPMNYADNAYSFRQDSTFLYYFGISMPKLAAAVDLDSGEEILFGDEMTLDEIVWMGRQETLKEKSLKAGMEQVLPLESLHTFLQKIRHQKRSIHYLPPYRPENVLRLLHLLGIEPASCKENASLDFIKAVISQRSIKSSEEINEIEKAVNITREMHLTAMKVAAAGMSENAIAAAIHAKALDGGGNIAYPIILTVHGEILHNHHHENILKDGQLVLNDSGAETAMGYAGDLTRTFPVSTRFTEAQKEVYNIVLNALESSAALLKPGMRYLDVHLHACKTLVNGLKELGLMKGDTDEAVAAGAHAMFFQCGTGHMMGLDVHDMEDLGEEYVGYTDNLRKNTNQFGLKSLRLGRELQSGFVLTVEPGIYFIPELMDRWKADGRFTEFINYTKLGQYRNFGGIRIEDNYVITDGSAQLLGKPLAKTIQEIEALRG